MQMKNRSVVIFTRNISQDDKCVERLYLVRPNNYNWLLIRN